MTVREVIEQKLASLSPSERRIARLVIEKYPVSALGGIEDIARQAQVSAPTVTRFVRRPSFPRFVDFQQAIRFEVQDNEASPLARLQKHHAAPLLAGTDADLALMDDLTASIRQLGAPPVTRAVNAAAMLIAMGRKRVFTLGGRFRSIAAQYLAFQMNSLRGEVHSLTQPASGMREDRIADFARRDIPT